MDYWICGVIIESFGIRHFSSAINTCGEIFVKNILKFMHCVFDLLLRFAYVR